MRRTLLVSDGDWSAFVERPFAASVLAIALLAFVIPLLPGLIARLRGERFEGKKIVFGEED
jgi:putative tricarboxylic transport membrane protein